MRDTDILVNENCKKNLVYLIGIKVAVCIRDLIDRIKTLNHQSSPSVKKLAIIVSVPPRIREMNRMLRMSPIKAFNNIQFPVLQHVYERVDKYGIVLGSRENTGLELSTTRVYECMTRFENTVIHCRPNADMVDALNAAVSGILF